MFLRGAWSLFLVLFIGVSTEGSRTLMDTYCRGKSLDLSVMTKLDKICNDCFDLYKEPEIFGLCRAECFGTEVFVGCMESLLVRDELRTEVAAYLENAHHNYIN